ncbi:MAG: hypothetical protein ACKOC6_02405 [bacterium]
MDHSPGFLALVQDSRTRVREVTVDDFLGRLEAGERVVLHPADRVSPGARLAERN